MKCEPQVIGRVIKLSKILITWGLMISLPGILGLSIANFTKVQLNLPFLILFVFLAATGVSMFVGGSLMWVAALHDRSQLRSRRKLPTEEHPNH